MPETYACGVGFALRLELAFMGSHSTKITDLCVPLLPNLLNTLCESIGVDLQVVFSEILSKRGTQICVLLFGGPLCPIGVSGRPSPLGSLGFLALRLSIRWFSRECLLMQEFDLAQDLS